MSYRRTVSLALGGSQTGLTLSAQLVDVAGASVGGAVTSGFVEIGLGNYLWDYAAWPDGHRGGVKFTAAAVLKAFLAVNPEDFEFSVGYTVARAARLDLIGPGPFSPLVKALTVVRGDDYLAADGRALDFLDELGVWPTLTGATIAFEMRNAASEVGTTAGSVIVGSGGGKQVRVELSAAFTSARSTGEYTYHVRGTLANGHVITLRNGIASVIR